MNAPTGPASVTLRDDLRLLVHSHIPLIAAETTEEERLQSLLCAIAGELHLPLFVWSMTAGLVRHGAQGALYGTDDAGKCLANIALMHDDAIYLFKDGEQFLKDGVLLRLLRDLSAKLKGARRSIVLCAPSLTIPPEITDLVAEFHLGLPDHAAMLAALRETLAEVSAPDGMACPLDPAAQDRVAQALCGLTLERARAILRKCVIGGGCATGQLAFHVLEEKRKAMGQEGALAAASEGFSGAEIEQAIVAALYTAFSRKAQLSTAIICAELGHTVPLSVTRREDISAIREWACHRAVPAAGPPAQG